MLVCWWLVGDWCLAVAFWLSVAGASWLLVVGCLLRVVDCLFVVCCLVFGVSCLVFVDCCSLYVVVGLFVFLG